jgi:hypothetical protein
MNLPRGEAARKRVELFKQAIGSLSRLAVLVYAPNLASPQLLHEVEATAKERMIHVLPINVSKPEDLDAAFKEAQQSGAQAIMTLQGRSSSSRDRSSRNWPHNPNCRWREANPSLQKPVRCSR